MNEYDTILGRLIVCERGCYYLMTEPTREIEAFGIPCDNGEFTVMNYLERPTQNSYSIVYDDNGYQVCRLSIVLGMGATQNQLYEAYVNKRS
jgi:hypothetical protein